MSASTPASASAPFPPSRPPPPPSTVWVTTKLSMGTAANRDKVFGLYSECARHAWFHEPGVLKYFLALPRAFDDDTSLYVFQEYTDQAALSAHFSSPRELLIADFLESDPVILTPIVDTLLPRCGFTRTNELPDDPTIVYASIAYKSPAKREEALCGWMDVAVETASGGAGTLSYSILEDMDDYSSVKVLEIHESEEWLFEVHAKRTSVVRNKTRYGPMRQHVEHVRLRRAGGFLKR
ncbi:mRNA splicing protein [Ascosphaera pollenicola]|nr:mRNA splicing protein [Ascosphaera pollenicola]